MIQNYRYLLTSMGYVQKATSSERFVQQSPKFTLAFKVDDYNYTRWCIADSKVMWSIQIDRMYHIAPDSSSGPIPLGKNKSPTLINVHVPSSITNEERCFQWESNKGIHVFIPANHYCKRCLPQHKSERHSISRAVTTSTFHCWFIWCTSTTQ